MVGRQTSPTGVIRVIIDGTGKAERKEIAVVESVMEVIVKVVEVVVDAPRSVAT
jgi:hypothetical protein